MSYVAGIGSPKPCYMQCACLCWWWRLLLAEICCVSGVLECTKDTRYSQLRMAALDALSSIVKATQDQHLEAADMHADIMAAVTSLRESEKNAVVLGKADALQRLLMAA